MLNLEYEPSLRRGYQPMCEWENQVKSLLTSDFNLKTDPCVNGFFFLGLQAQSSSCDSYSFFMSPCISWLEAGLKKKQDFMLWNSVRVIKSFWGKITRKICKLAYVNYNKNDAFNHQEHLSYIHLLSFPLAQDLPVDQP